MSEQKVTDLMIVGLPTGERLLADVSAEGGSFLLSNTLQIMERVDQDGSMRMGLVPFMPYAEDGISVPMQSVILAVPSAELRRHHQNAFSKIITPEQQGIILPS